MAEITNIAWTKSTFNPWIGCTKIGPGCEHCYAHAGDVRFTGGKRWGPGAPRHRTTFGYWRKPLSWNKQAKKSKEFWPVFCASQADVFDNEVDQEWREDLWQLIKATPFLTWQLVTKRVSNIPDMLPADWGNGYQNVWLLVTTVTQMEFERDWSRLSYIPARRRGLSIEPQIEEIELTHCGSIIPDWVICGGESAQLGKARPFDLQWAERLRIACHTMQIPFFMKQLGSRAVFRGGRIPLEYTGKGDDPDEWPPNLRVRQFPIT